MTASFFDRLLQLDGAMFEGFLVLLCALPLARLAPLPREMQPLVWFGVLAKRLAAKVNHNHRHPSQQLTAGLLSALLLILPFWAIVSFLLQLAAFPWFFEFLVLYLCLSDASFAQVAEDIDKALQRNDKEHARAQLGQWLARDTGELSEVGIVKATIEKLVTSPVYGTAAVVFFFAIAGAPAVLAVRMVKQLELVWPPVSPKYRYFSRPVQLLSHVLLLLPSWLWSLTLAILGGPKGFAALLRPLPGKQPHANALRPATVAANILGVELCGPQRHNGERVAIAPIKGGPKPDRSAIAPAVRLSNRACLLWFLFLLQLPLTWTVLRLLQAQ
ncbi:cobalamin biosynthesis protein CobD/CbiB [Shewanella cyperi]|uniref:cobalamin biosynthesis protein CobD/CbiB n=1 Tax=Shewanella cyperi TaxID=2814292 RepID=UPI001A946B9F|nr:cobalamin biosynthesis protein [Shewanella cyperi]QSX41581.1 cobalamin biosynthesis protein [Shewanella cyperi]